MIELERPWPSRLQATDTVLFFGFRWGFARRCGVPHATRPRAACTRCADDARGILVAILEDFPEVKIALPHARPG